MSKIINTDLPAKRRIRLLRFISNSILILDKNLNSKEETNDLIAFIILSLSEIEKTIIQSTAPWERRDYWIKADQLRKEWLWVKEIKEQLIESKTHQGWLILPNEIQLLKEKTKIIKPLNKIGDDFWRGAYTTLLKKE
jgi:hypothetical protein